MLEYLQFLGWRFILTMALLIVIAIGGIIYGIDGLAKHQKLSQSFAAYDAAYKAEHRLAVDACLEKSGLPVVVTDGVQIAVGVGCAERIGELPTILYLERKD